MSEMRIDRAMERIAELERALHLARIALTHDVPSDCWATGPLTGDPIEDYVVCPGCRANHAMDSATAKPAKGE